MRLHDPDHRDFASDNHAGLHPEVLAALAEANGGHVHSYGDDPYTARLADVVSDHFGPTAQAYPVFNGTGGNVVALSAITPRWGAVITPVSAHMHTDEAGAPEQMAGLKLLTTPADDGKLTVAALAAAAEVQRGVHSPQPTTVAVTQSTEAGTTYTPDEIAALTDLAHARGLRVYVDGARLANAAAHLGLPLRALTTDVGVDVVTLGGTKNGALDAEVVVVLDPHAADGTDRVRKMNAQLSSKARFVAAQLVALYGTDLWLDCARHANTMAARLAEGLAMIPDVRITTPVQANAVLAQIPPAVTARLREHWMFHDWTPGPTVREAPHGSAADRAHGARGSARRRSRRVEERSGGRSAGDGSSVRLMCAWDTTEQDVDALVEAAVSAR